jgi:hypothetical protein
MPSLSRNISDLSRYHRLIKAKDIFSFSQSLIRKQIPRALYHSSATAYNADAILGQAKKSSSSNGSKYQSSSISSGLSEVANQTYLDPKFQIQRHFHFRAPISQYKETCIPQKAVHLRLFNIQTALDSRTDLSFSELVSV